MQKYRKNFVSPSAAGYIHEINDQNTFTSGNQIFKINRESENRVENIRLRFEFSCDFYIIFVHNYVSHYPYKLPHMRQFSY